MPRAKKYRRRSKSFGLAAVQSSRFKSSRWSWGRFQQFQPFQASRQFKVQRFNVQWPQPITDFP